LHKFFSSKITRKTFTSICRDLKVDQLISNAMSKHATKTGASSDKYRDDTDINILEQKRKEIAKWNEMFLVERKNGKNLNYGERYEVRKQVKSIGRKQWN